MTKILKQKEEMLQYHPKGFMKKFVKDNYEHLQKRVEEIKSDKEYNDAFYPGQYYEIHSLLYSKLGKKLIVEMSLLMALSILFIMDYERLQKTNDLVDATRTGKRIMDYKAFAGTLSGILFSAILCIVSQTTFNYNKFQDIVEIIAKKGYDITVLNTICNATEVRQTEARKVAQCSDVMIVIGDRHSSNTQKLFEICKNECKNTYYIQTSDEMDYTQIRSNNNVGITAGASTPNNIIEEVSKNVRNEL